MSALYETDIIAWAKSQADLLRSGKVTELDVKNIAEEIDDIGKGEQRELASRMSVLLGHLLAWEFQPSHRCNSWEAIIQTQRRSIERRVEKTPSLKASLQDASWWADAFDDALALAVKETDMPLSAFPKDLQWHAVDIFNADFFPTTSKL